MRRKILIVEQTDTLRSIAETVLRQNGYDVISVTAANKAREVLELSLPDLMIIGADLAAPDGSPYYEQLNRDPRAGAVPRLLFEPAGKSDTDYSSEELIPRPFEPKGFLEQVSRALDARSRTADPSEAAAGGSLVDDDFLDAALGLDRIDVTDSEVMHKTALSPRSRKKASREKLIGMDVPAGDDTDGVPTVESVTIDDDSSQVKPGRSRRKTPPVTGTGKLEILSDQYGLTEPVHGRGGGDGVHDYNWFVDAMKSDSHHAAGGPTSPDNAPLAFTETSETVDPITPVPDSHGSPQTSRSAGVDQFIDEFKREMAQARSEEEEPLLPPPSLKATVDTGDEMNWEETLEQIGPSQIDLFIKEFAHEVGLKVAAMMHDRIDPDKLLRLIKSEILERQKKSSR